MNSTNDAPNIAKINELFQKKILPLAKKLRAEGKLFFAVSEQPEKSTYYVPRKKITAVPADFEIIPINSSENLENAFVDLWESQGYPELSVLANSLGILAGSFRETEEQSENVSSSIYIMF